MFFFFTNFVCDPGYERNEEYIFHNEKVKMQDIKRGMF